MRTHRGVLAIFVLAALGAASAVGVWYLFAAPLPDPHTASRDDLMRWLVLRDLEAETLETQVAIVDRLEQELDHGIELDGVRDSLNGAQRDRLTNNIQRLKYLWFSTRVDRYVGLPPVEQKPFLKNKLEVVFDWAAIDEQLAGDATPNSADDSAAGQIFDQIETWIDEAPPAQSDRMYRVVFDGVLLWLATYDLEDWPTDTRRELAERIVRELEYGTRADEVALDLTEAERDRLVANGKLLLEAWLHEQAEMYQTLAKAERSRYLDTQIDRFMKWGVLELLASNSPQDSASTGSQFSALTEFIKLVETWIARAAPEEQARLRRLMTAVQLKIVERQFGPSGAGK